VQRSEVAAIGVSGQQHGMVPLDAAGRVIRPAKLWCDVESASQAEWLSEQVGYKIVPGFTASKLLWLANEEPESYDQLSHLLLPHDYINYWLTGNMVMEVHNIQNLF
jgi:xylulokinase